MPDSATLAVFAAASLALLITPGPAVLYIVNRSIAQGWPAGVVSSFGMGVGSLVHLLIAWLGLSAILFSSSTALDALRYAGAAYLVFLGVQTLRSRRASLDGAGSDRQGLRQVFSEAIVVNLLNPKAALFFIAFMPQFVDPALGSVGGQLLLLSGVFLAIALVTDSAYALMASKLGDLLRGSSTFLRWQRAFSATVYIGLGVAAALAGTGARGEEPQGEVSELTVMVWNIWHGGNDEQLVEDGRPHVVDIIRATDADIVLMIETYGIGQKVSQELGFNYHLIAPPGTAPDDPGINLSIHSRYPLGERSDFYRHFNVGGIEVELSPTQRIVVFDTWFNYDPWEDRPAELGLSADELVAWERSGTRPAEVTAILDGMQPWVDNADQVPVIMGGDHNSWSHLDWSEETRRRNGGLVVPWWTTSAIASRGFVDAFRALHPNPMTDPGITWDTPGVADEHRIDYIYYVGDKLRPVSAEVHKVPYNDTIQLGGRTALYPSDHGFVLTTFRWE